MSNFKTTFLRGKNGENFGLSTGIPALNRAINGLQKKCSIGIAAAPKVGKTTLADFAFLISPYLQMLEQERLDDIEWIYFSLEVDRVNKEFSIAAHFMWRDFGVYEFIYKGVKYVVSHDYLMGKLVHTNEDGSLEMVIVSEEHEAMVKEIYRTRIIPMFGEFDEQGKQIRKGKIIFIGQAENPTGMRNYLIRYAKQYGTVTGEHYNTTDENGNNIVKTRITGYIENNPKKYTIVITDHVRKLPHERGFKKKENIDKWLEYSTEFVNIYSFTMINICHSNREVGNVDRLKFAGETIYPTEDDVKDTGNLAEESHIFITMFNPNDEKYNLKKHFGVDLTNKAYPNYKSIHIAQARYVPSPLHIQVNMYGNVLLFTPLAKKS